MLSDADHVVVDHFAAQVRRIAPDAAVCFTSKGRLHWLKVHEIPEIGPAAKGRPIVNLLRLSQGESLAALMSVREFPDVDPPIVSVSTELPGANPQVVESAVTDILVNKFDRIYAERRGRISAT